MRMMLKCLDAQMHKESLTSDRNQNISTEPKKVRL